MAHCNPIFHQMLKIMLTDEQIAALSMGPFRLPARPSWAQEIQTRSHKVKECNEDLLPLQK